MRDLYYEFFNAYKNKAIKNFWCKTTDDGVKYILSFDEHGTLLERRIRVIQLSNFRCFSDRRYMRFFDLEDAIDEQVDYFMEYLEEHDYKRFDPNKEYMKLPFFEKRRYEADNMIKIEETDNGKLINGIILGLFNNKEFKDVYTNGVKFDFPNCLTFSNKYGYYINPPDWDDYDELYKKAKKEMKDFVTFVFGKINDGASDIPTCVYPIINNRLYFLTGQEYYNLQNNHKMKKNFKCFNFQLGGIFQRFQHLLKDWEYADGTLKIIRTNPTILIEKPYIDLTNEIELGMGTEEFIIGLLTDDENVLAYVQEVLHQEGKKETDRVLKK